MKSKFGLNISEKEYRKLNYPSYSLLSDLIKEGPFCLSKPRADISDLEAIKIGSLVDKYITDSGNIGKVFVLDKVPSDKPKVIIDEMIERFAEFPNQIDLLDSENHPLIMEICDKYDYYKQKDTRLKYLKEYEKFIEVYTQPKPDEYLIMTTYQRDTALRVVKAIKEQFPLFSDKNGLGQVKLIGKINGVELKVMFDLILVNEKTKVLLPFDLKTGINLYSEFPKGNYVKFNYYLQGALYKEVLSQNLVGTPYEGYKIAPFRFLYCSRNEFLPMVFKMTKEAHEKALNGFYSGGMWRKGLYQIVEEYKFYRDNPSNLYIKDYIKQTDSGVNFLEYDL